MITRQQSQPRAVLYCRVSTVHQVENHSLPTQLKACREFCVREGLEVAAEFMEEGESAKTADRTKLNAMLDFVTNRKNRVSTVVVYSINRFTRRVEDHYMLRSILTSKGITLRSVTEKIDDTAEGKLMETVLAGLAQFDNDKRSDRTKAGMEAVVACGGYPFRCPLGYLPAEKPFGGRTLPILKPDPERASLIRRAFELVADGVSKAEALRTVTALGLRTLRGKSLTPQTFNEFLKKAIYCGRIEIWNVDVRGNFETIVTEELFDRVQVVLRTNVGGAAGPHLRFNPDFPLRHFTCCAFCAKPLTGSSPKGRNGRYSYYHCRSRECSARNYPVREVEELFYRFVERLQPNPEMVALFRDAVVAAWKMKQADSERDTAVLKRRLAELNARKTQLRESFIYRQEISKHEYDEEKERLVEQIVLVEQELLDASVNELDVEAILSFAEQVLTNAGRVWWEASPDTKRQIQQVLFPNGVHFDGETFGTSRTNLVFSELAPICEPIEGLVAHTGFEPVLPP